MSNIAPNILGKIKKCLALSGSDNPCEAAAALRQARALMEKHGVSTHEITMADIGEITIASNTMSRDKPAAWETRLAAIVGRAFGCQIMVSRTTFAEVKGYLNKGDYVFIGLKQQAEIAGYTANVLIRKCKSARQNWLAEMFGGLGKNGKGVKAKKTRMGDAFAEGWALAISKLVVDFANPQGIDDAIQQHVEKKSRGDEAPTRTLSEKDIGRHEQAAAILGMRAANNERLYRPMESTKSPLALPAEI